MNTISDYTSEEVKEYVNTALSLVSLEELA